MSILMLLKIFSDCCICFAILGSGPVVFSLPLLLPALLCGIAAGIATFFDGKGWDIPRRLCALLPLGCLLLAENGGQMLILAAPAIYTAAVILRGKLELEYSGYRHFFIRSLILLSGVYAVANIWLFLTQITDEAVLRLDTAVILRYGLVHLLCGVVLQRQLRLGVGYRAEGGRRQMVMLLGTATTIVAGVLAAEPLLRKGAGALLNYLFSLLMTPIGFVADWISKLFARLMVSEGDEEVYEEFIEHIGNIGLGGSHQGGQAAPQPEQESFDATAIWAVLAGLLLLIAVAILLHSFYKRSVKTNVDELSSRLVTAPKKKKATAFSNRGRVRQIYRDFLRVEKNLGMQLRHNYTSEDVLSRIHPDTDRSSAAQLRQVYLAARYDDRQNISRSQVEQARRAIKGTRRTKN